MACDFTGGEMTGCVFVGPAAAAGASVNNARTCGRNGVAARKATWCPEALEVQRLSSAKDRTKSIATPWVPPHLIAQRRTITTGSYYPVLPLQNSHGERPNIAISLGESFCL